MPAPSFRHHRRRSLLLRASAAGLVLAGALSTLAGVSEPAPDAVAPLSARTGGGESSKTAPAAALATSISSPARQPASIRRADAGNSHAAPAGGAFPFAPGGDDILPSSEAPPPYPRAAPAALPAAASAQAPRLWLERTTVGLGETAVLHLTTADDGLSCQGDGALAGKVVAGHRIEFRATTGGQHRLGVLCTGTGGAVAAELTLTVPLPVALSSSEHLHSPEAGRTGLPRLKQLGLRAAAAAGTREQDLMVPGDYLQQGRRSLFVVAAGTDGDAAAHVMARDGTGRWTDRSADLLDEAERGVCASAVQAIGSDFNRDGRPDVWVVCEGRQLLFLSQPDGRYRRIETPFALHAVLAEARDVDGDGWPDIVTLDTGSAMPRTLLLLGRGDGRFEAGPAEAWRLSLPLSAGSR